MPWPTAFRIAQSDGTAGSNVSQSITGDTRKHILHVQCTLTTDSNAANRYLKIRAAQGGNHMYSNYVSAAQTASTAIEYHFDIGCGSPYQIGSASAYMLPLNPWFIVEPAWAFQINVDNIQAGDQVTGILLTFGRWARPGEV